MIKDIRHTGIVVEDLAESLHFYQDVLGFKIFKQMDEQGPFIDAILGLQNVKVTTIKMSAPDGSLLELLYYKSHHKKKQESKIHDVGISHIAFTVKDIDAVYEKLSIARINCYSEPKLSDDGKAKVFFCRAPEGTFIELVQELS
jgi:catechol 2,3-dioxygenase-like lactoylglutathione lyase family enzyme